MGRRGLRTEDRYVHVDVLIRPNLVVGLTIRIEFVRLEDLPIPGPNEDSIRGFKSNDALERRPFLKKHRIRIFENIYFRIETVGGLISKVSILVSQDLEQFCMPVLISTK